MARVARLGKGIDVLGEAKTFLARWGKSGWQAIRHCLPVGLCRFLRFDPPKGVFLCRGDGFALVREHYGYEEAMGHIGSWGGERSEPLTQLRKLPVHVLRMPAEESLQPRMTLPRAAMENLHQVVRFEMDRYTPFPAHQVYWHFRILEGVSNREEVPLQLFVLPRRVVDPWIGRMRELDCSPARLEVEGDPEGLNLLPADQQGTSGRNWALRITGALLILTLGLAGAAVAVPLWQQRAQMREAQRRAEQLRPQARAVQELHERLQEAGQSAQTLRARWSETPKVTILLEELSRLLPDHTFLEWLRLQGDQLTIQGESGDASELVEKLEASAMIQGPNFSSPVQGTSGDEKAQFQIQATVIPTKQEDAAS